MTIQKHVVFFDNKPIENICSREQLVLLLLKDSSDRPMVYIGNTMGYLSSIQREDGSGYSFNVTMYTPDYSDKSMPTPPMVLKTFHVRFEK
jgi:hypothetical protein